MMKQKFRPYVLVILDGWGMAPKLESNPITLAHTPNFKKFWSTYPHSILEASGKYVGLPKGQEGNSEAGHLNIGSGRIVKQDAVTITDTISDGTFFKNSALKQAVDHVLRKRSTLHLMGLLSNHNSGHSNPEHVEALLRYFRSKGIVRIRIHLFTDGRDTPKFSALGLLKKFQKTLAGDEQIASITGRLWAMDRKKDWQKTEKTYSALVLGEGIRAQSAERAVEEAYKRGESDEFVSPTIICDGKKPYGLIDDHDAVVFFNLRSDRARQLAKPFVQSDFQKLNPGSFKRKKLVRDLMFVCMTDFGPDLRGSITAFPSRDVKQSLPFVLSDLKQLYVAESEKYAHITYFFNGGYANPVAREQRVMVASPAVISYDQTPAMSAREITQVVTAHLEHHLYDFFGVNYANADMVGHTGNLKAAIQAVEVIDECLGKMLFALKKRRGVLIITADHGNIEEMVNLKSGKVDTEHSTNPVPFLFLDTAQPSTKFHLLPHGILADVSPTILDHMGIQKPKEMTGKSLLITQMSELKSQNHNVKLKTDQKKNRPEGTLQF